jgi:hypothetical protein
MYDYEEEEMEDSKLEFEQIIELSKMTKLKQVVTGLNLGYFPLAGFIFEIGDEEGRKLLDEYVAWLFKVKPYMQKNKDKIGNGKNKVQETVDAVVKPPAKK